MMSADVAEWMNSGSMFLRGPKSVDWKAGITPIPEIVVGQTRRLRHLVVWPLYPLMASSCSLVCS